MSFTNFLSGLEVYPILGSKQSIQKIHVFDFSEENKDLLYLDMNNKEVFENYINNQISTHAADIGLGKYAENRILYRRFGLFEDEESRSFHLGIDLWKEAESPIFCPLDSEVHSFADNSNLGDYGPTIVLKHQIKDQEFCTLYGHLSKDSLTGLEIGKPIKEGQEFARLGSWEVNVNWPPHLHFQIIKEMAEWKGDYPGVCKLSEKESWMDNCPDPNLLLRFKI